MKEPELIRVYLKRKYVLAFRIVMLLVSWPFIFDVYQVIVAGSANLGTHIAVRGEDWGYYAHLSKKGIFALFFLWLGTFGTKDIATVDKGGR